MLVPISDRATTSHDLIIYSFVETLGTPESRLPFRELARIATASTRADSPTTTSQTSLSYLKFAIRMSADPPSTDPGELQFCITDIELQPPIKDPNCKISVKVFIDDELVCSLPWIDNTQPLRWSRLILCHGTPDSTISLRLCKSLKGKQRFFTFPSYQISDMDEESGDISLEHSELIWVVTVKSLTPATTEEIFADELEKLSRTEGVYDSLKPQETTKYLFKTVFKLANISAEALPGRTRKLYFVLFMRTWEILERQTQLDEPIQNILRGLVRIQDVVEILGQAPSPTLANAIGQSKEPIDDILELLKDASVCIFNRLAAGDSGAHDDPLLGSVYNIEGYLDRLETLQKEFHNSWCLPTTLGADTLSASDNEPPVVEWEELPGAEDEESTKLPDPFEILNSLRPTNPIGYDPDQACMSGTRKTILNRVISWTQNHDSSESFMWISGQVGMGKSAIATSLCQYLDDIGRLAGSFFCKHDDPDFNNPLQLVNNLVYSLASRCPPYAREVANVIRTNRLLSNAYLKIRYRGLIKEPLKKLKRLSVSTPLIIVIDALDECGDSNSREKAFHILHDMSQLVPWLKVVITARPEGDLVESFERGCPREAIVHLETYDASDDIRAYIQDNLGEISQKERWSHPSIDQLCTMAQGVFLWATLAVQYIKKSTLPASSRLQRLLDNRRSPVTDHFNALYSRILRTIFGGDDEETKDAYFQCIGAILATSGHDPLAIPDLQHLLLVAGRVDQTTLERVLKNLGSLLVLMKDQYARFHHSSFRDYISDSSRSGDFAIKLDQYKAEPAACCLQLMQQNLRFNICKLESSQLLNNDIPDLEARIRSNITPALKYACVHWIDHFMATPNQNLVAALKKFMEGPQLMYWFEVLSVLGRTDVATTGLSKLASLELTECKEWGAIVPWIADVHRFILSFNAIITESTPHLYVSALAFAPTGSLIAQRMRPYFPNTITISQGADSIWHPCIKSVLHPNAVQSLSISPDGLRVIVGYSDGSLSIWDRESGALASEPFLGHKDLVTSVVFSHDGNLVASSSYDATIRVWDVKSHLKTSHVLAGHIGPVYSVAFSPKSAIIASGSSDKTIRIWNSKSMCAIGEPYDGHSSRVSSLAFSPNGRKLVSGSWDRTIRVWSVDPVDHTLSGTPLVISEHSDSVTCVAFSPDGSRIVSGSSDKTIRAYDVPSGHDIVSSTALARHLDGVTSIAFSPDGKLVASSSLDGMVKLHDASTFTEISRPFGHSNAVNHIAFSPDGAYIVSGSADMTTRVWRFSTRRMNKPMAVAPLVGHSAAIHSIAVSKDGAKIISGSDDNTVRLWDAYTGAPIGDPLVGHSKTVYCVAFSHDGSRAASGSSDGMIKLWDVATRVAIQSHQLGRAVRCTAFSPDGTAIAFGTDDSEVYLWESTGWKIVGNPLLGHSRYVLSVVFSPDGACIASSSADRTIILWDTKTQGRLGNALQGHADYVRSVAFSPCGTQLASCSDDKTLKLWDIKTGNIIRQLGGHSGWVMSVAFSPDGLRLGSGSRDNTVRLWDIKTGEMIGQPFTGHSGDVKSIAFSPDGNYLISGSDDTTIQVWSLGASSEPPAPELANDLPGTFCWPSGTETPSRPHHPGWVTHEQQPLAFWLPAHYRQPDQFLSTPTQTPRTQLIFDYSKFMYGTAWTGVACDSINHGPN